MIFEVDNMILDNDSFDLEAYQKYLSGRTIKISNAPRCTIQDNCLIICCDLMRRGYDAEGVCSLLTVEIPKVSEFGHNGRLTEKRSFSDDIESEIYWNVTPNYIVSIIDEFGESLSYREYVLRVNGGYYD